MNLDKEQKQRESLFKRAQINKDFLNSVGKSKSFTLILLVGGGLEILTPDGAAVIEMNDQQPLSNNESPMFTLANEEPGYREVTNDLFPQLTTIYQ